MLQLFLLDFQLAFVFIIAHITDHHFITGLQSAHHLHIFKVAVAKLYLTLIISLSPSCTNNSYSPRLHNKKHLLFSSHLLSRHSLHTHLSSSRNGDVVIILHQLDCKRKLHHSLQRRNTAHDAFQFFHCRFDNGTSSCRHTVAISIGYFTFHFKMTQI